MVDVFISYSRANQAVVRQLADAVKRLGYSVWWDDELPAHVSYSDVIADRIETAKAAIVVWSESAAASQWVRAEADLARHQAKLIQASVDGRMPPMPFNQIQFAAIGDWRGEEEHPGWQKVKASLDALVGPAEAAASPLPAPAVPAPHKWHKLLIAVIAVALLFLAGAGLFAWLSGGAAPQKDGKRERTEAVPLDGSREYYCSRRGPVAQECIKLTDWYRRRRHRGRRFGGMAPRAGFEPATIRLTVERSTTELPGISLVGERRL